MENNRNSVYIEILELFKNWQGQAVDYKSKSTYRPLRLFSSVGICKYLCSTVR